MTSNKIQTLFKSQLISYSLTAVLLLTACFFIQFGREAHASKSWEYVQPNHENLFYWSITKGRAMSPRCDGNPYYFEVQGTRHIVPWTTAEMIGLFSKYTHIPLDWFFPAWHILMPFFTWLVIVLCCRKFWGYPLGSSAASAALILLSTLFQPGIQVILFRFTRPIDGMALLFLWVSLIYKGDRNKKTHLAAAGIVPSAALWLQPYYAVFGLWFTGLEYLHGFFKKENSSKADLLFWMTASGIFSAAIFAWYARAGDKNTIHPQVLFGAHPPFGPPLLNVLLALLWLGIVLAVVLFMAFILKQKITPLDRFMTESALFIVLVCGINGFVVIKTALVAHLYYFLPLIAMAIVGWIYEKVTILKTKRHFASFSKAILLAVVAVSALSVIKKTNIFFADFPALFIGKVLQYFFASLVCIVAMARFDLLRRLVSKRKILFPLIVLVAVIGYWQIPPNPMNKEFPYAGGYQWLKRNARKGDVVLTAAAADSKMEYLFLKTGLKSYYCYYGIDPNSFRAGFRSLFFAGLLLNNLDTMPYLEKMSRDEKIRSLKLNYVLMPIPSPFFEAVTNQLKGHLRLVYQDKKCLLWKVT